MNKKNEDIPVISPDYISKLEELRNNKSNLDPESKFAIKAVDLASKVINTIMSGNQIDPVFFKKMINDIEKRLDTASNNSVQKISKKKKLKIKTKS